MGTSVRGARRSTIICLFISRTGNHRSLSRPTPLHFPAHRYADKGEKHLGTSLLRRVTRFLGGAACYSLCALLLRVATTPFFYRILPLSPAMAFGLRRVSAPVISLSWTPRLTGSLQPEWLGRISHDKVLRRLSLARRR